MKGVSQGAIKYSFSISGTKYLCPALSPICCLVERRGVEIGAHKHPANQVREEADGLNAVLCRDRDGLPVLTRILCRVERGAIVSYHPGIVHIQQGNACQGLCRSTALRNGSIEWCCTTPTYSPIMCHI